MGLVQEGVRMEFVDRLGVGAVESDVELVVDSERAGSERWMGEEPDGKSPVLPGLPIDHLGRKIEERLLQLEE